MWWFQTCIMKIKSIHRFHVDFACGISKNDLFSGLIWFALSSHLTPLKVKCSAIRCILNFKSINCTWQRSRAPFQGCIILWQIHKTIHLQFMSWIVGCLYLSRNVATNQNLESDNPFYSSVLNRKFLYIFTLQGTLLLQKIQEQVFFMWFDHFTSEMFCNQMDIKV